MRQLSLFSILLFTFVLLFLAPNPAAAAFTPEAGEIPYQINNSDRIVIGTVSEVETHDNFANSTISVDEWLYNSLPEKTIIVRTSSWAEDARFTKNESVLLMLNDQSPEKGVFYMSFGELGKHPVSDRDAVIKELKAQGKWKEEDQTGNKTNETEVIANAGTAGNQKESITENKTFDNGKEENMGVAGRQEGKSNSTQEPKSTPFISSLWILVIVFGTIMYVKKTK